MPVKISSNFAGFTADQWKNWIMVYSVALKDVLPTEHMRYWLLFVKACILLGTRSLTTQNISLADQYLVLFCKKFQEVNGPSVCTPNMHLHLHLSECLKDYGPVYGFWCYAFERYNGVLGAYPTNQRCIGPQIMKKFLTDQELRAAPFPVEFKSMHQLLKDHSTSGGGVALMQMESCSNRRIQLSYPKLKDDCEFQVCSWENCIGHEKEKVLLH